MGFAAGVNHAGLSDAGVGAAAGVANAGVGSDDDWWSTTDDGAPTEDSDDN